MPLISAQNESSDAGRGTGSFLRLLRQHERQLQVYVVSLVPHWADADDIVQDTKIKLWERFAEYDSSGDFGAWSRAIAYFQVLTYRNKTRRERARLSPKALELVADAATAAAGEVDDRHRALVGCLARLTDSARSLLWRCYSEETSVKQIAEVLGRSVRGTQRAVAEIRCMLQDCIERTIHREERL